MVFLPQMVQWNANMAVSLSETHFGTKKEKKKNKLTKVTLFRGKFVEIDI